ncbi:LysR family transcriptional regulator [Gordonia otitidis]|uniref:LysR family transcriptional regulator n=1 Tax=Gordonia otitidis (strain DSM 44809 / CCUG 52243 / JCM 12355 / NBRC 100426 / IFM 10032) TaxID=1108044 RepID=H5TJW6_GORO1|nr:LysR family transcriptional regulator [Gordonia otitidis]GAB33774.1 putative LysR family transcriptional regulator [Gordonia otitidis NBRC 100426]
MIDPHRLRVFRAVVAEGSVGGAASALGYTPSAVSQHLATLQRETGLTLMERDGRGVVATEAGRILAAESEAVFDQLARVDGLVADLRNGRAGALRVTYFGSAGAAWMPTVVAAVRREFPALRLDLRLLEISDPTLTPPDIEVGVGVDATGSTIDAGQLRDYDVTPLVTEEYRVVVTPDSPFATRDSVLLRELADDVWIDNDIARGPCREALLRACTAAGFTPCFGVEAHDYPTAISFVAAGIGLTVVPALALVDVPADVRVIPIAEPTPRRSISIRRRHSLREHDAADRIVELVREQARRTHGELVGA